MKIAVDASRACEKNKTGVEYYSLALFETWKKINLPDELLFFAPNDAPETLQPLPKNWKWINVKGARLWSQYYLLRALKKIEHDILFVPSHIIPAFYKKTAVTTVHDLGFLEKPELYNITESSYQKFANFTSLKNANGIITPSKYTKESLTKYLGIEPQKIKVIPHGYRKDLFNTSVSETLPEKIIKPYIYFVGRIEKKKNIINLLEAFKYLRQERRIQHQLILAGKDGFGADEIKQYYEKMPNDIKKDIHFLDYVDDKTNSALMRNADIFFFPSLIEGFGFPIIEAMASGVPVVCSNSTSLLEIAGNATVLVDPNKPFSMAAALSKIINSANLKELMVRSGLRQAKKFNWEKAASETLDYIRLVATRQGK